VAASQAGRLLPVRVPRSTWRSTPEPGVVNSSRIAPETAALSPVPNQRPARFEKAMFVFICFGFVV
jgi:hypothetical protein